jgi:hypothetical protein
MTFSYSDQLPDFIIKIIATFTVYKDRYAANKGNEAKLNNMQIISIFYDYSI